MKREKYLKIIIFLICVRIMKFYPSCYTKVIPALDSGMLGPKQLNHMGPPHTLQEIKSKSLASFRGANIGLQR